MSPLIDPAEHDPRTIDELLNVALMECDEDQRWNAISALHWRGTYEVLRRAASLCGTICPEQRRLGADILGQLGVPNRTFPRECCKILIGLLKSEEDADALHAALVALSHHDCPEAADRIAEFASHTDSSVRYAVALALAGDERPLAIDCLIRLSADHDADVRDWATFGLGTQTELDTPQIRDALAARLNDSDDDTRAEALVGLARRNDRRVVAALRKELASDCIGTLVLEAAELVEAPALLPPLIQLRDWKDMDRRALEAAIAACSGSAILR